VAGGRRRPAAGGVAIREVTGGAANQKIAGGATNRRCRREVAGRVDG
jgi:hypothetical protein